ncbi:CDK5 regulatory subunit-associated protein 2 [Aquarana catesbeiana]|uniref:CDK5 regulatory subunit-associated protein 2 n=1 Tax=Aquarana catesbeiana TaxID=8400 RepID=UPI003CC9D4BE
MERNSPPGLGEQFLRGNHLTMQRDSWSEEIDPLRSNHGRDRWSENEDNLQRENSHTLDGESLLLDRDSLSEEDDQPMKPIERDRQSLPANGDTVGFEFMGRHHPVRSRYERERVMAQDYDPPYEGDSLSIENSSPRGSNERACDPVKGYDRLSVDRAHTMKDFEKQITELKKENFNLKLRIYFLEEQVQRHCDNSSEELHRMNIELKVEVESLKHEYQEKQNLLIRASKAMESLAGEHNVTIQQLKNDHLKQLRELGEASRQKLQLLEELKHEKGELEKVCVLLDQERMQRFNAEERLLAVKEQYNKSMGILEERDWIIQCLNETLRSKDALITQLEKQIHTMMPSDTSNGNATKTVSLLPESDLQEGRSQSPALTCRDCLATKSSEEKEENANEWQKKVKEMGNVINELQQKVEASKAGLANEEKNAVKRDKAIQGLTLALKKKTKENEKLLKEIENLNATLAEAREPGLRDQSLRKDSDPDYKKLIITIQAQQDLCSRLHEYERESGSLQKELDAIVMLRKWLERDIQSNQDLRKILEAQIMAKYRESDTMSFPGDQTSYLSICLDHLDENNMMEAVNRALVKASETQTVLKDSSLTEESLNNSQNSKLELSVIEDAKDESATAVATHPKHEFTEPSQSTVSSSTQTTLKYYADQAILVDGFALGKESSESIKNRDEEILSNAESLRFTSDVHKRHNDKQQKCFSNNLTKSRIPVLLKSPLRKWIKREAFLTSRENDHLCLEKELQEENNRLLEELACAKLEIGALKSNKGTPQGWDDSDSAGIEPLIPILQDRQIGGLSGLNQHVCLEKELQEENRKLLEQLECAKLDIKALQSYKEKPKGWDDSDKPEPSGSILEGDLQAERLSGLKEHVCLEKELKGENHKLLEQLASAKLEITAFKSHKEKPKGTLQTWDDSDNAGNEPTRQSLQGELQAERLSGLNEHVCLEKELKEENHKLLEQLECAKLEIKALKSNKEIPTQGWDESNHPGNESWRPILQGDLQAERLGGLNEHAFLERDLQEENRRLLEQLNCAKLEIKALKLNQEKGWDNSDNKPSRHILQEDLQAERLSGLNQHVCLEKELQEENRKLLEQLECAKLDIKALQSYKEKPKGWDYFDNAGNEPSRLILQGDLQAERLSGLNEHVCLEKELKEENRKLLEQLASAKLEIKAFKSHKEKPKGTPQGWDNSENEPSRQNSQEDLQAERLSGLNQHVCLEKELQEENSRLLEQLESAKLEIKALKLSKEKVWDNSDNAWNEPSRLIIRGDPQAGRLSGLNEHVCLEKELQEENCKLLELASAKLETGALKANQESPKGWDDSGNAWNDPSRPILQRDLQAAGRLSGLNEHVYREKELQEENHKLLEELACAKLEIRALNSNKGWDDSDHAGNEPSRLILQGDLQAERLSGLSGQLKYAQIEMGKLQPVENVVKSTEFACKLEKAEKEQMDSLQQTFHKELQLRNDKSALDDNHPLNVSEITNNNSALDNANIAERDLSAQSLHKELQLENLRLAEQLKSAQMDIEKLQSREVHLQNKNALSDLDSAYEKEDVAIRTLIKELQLENQRLVEQLKCAQVEIETLREEKASEDNSFRLDNVDTEDRDSEHSFIDKTITNTIGLSEIHNGNPDFELQVNSHNFTCQNIAGLCCHRERFCIECANNQETLVFQSSSFKKVSTIQKECKLLTVSQSHRPFEDTSLSKYDLLVQSQARELSHHRQRIKESHNLSVVCSKNFINVIKAFEDLILTASLDSNIALGFQEQLAQTVEWLKELEYKLSDAYYGEDDANSDHSADSLLYTPSRLVPGHKMWADKHGCHVLGLVEDYNALRKQILEAKTVLEETEAFLDHGVQTAVLNMTDHFGNIFFEKFNRTKQSLEEASCLLKLLWRVSLPMKTHSSYNIRQVEETNLEMTQLRKRVLEQDKLLSGMVKRVYSENQMKEDIEKLILNQLAMTHKILKRAKGNLAVQVVDKQ